MNAPIAGSDLALGRFIAEACYVTGVRPKNVLGKGRTSRRVVQVRAVLAYLLRMQLDLKFQHIAALLGRGEHSSVLVAVRRVTRAVEDREPWALELLDAIDKVKRPEA